MALNYASNLARLSCVGVSQAQTEAEAERDTKDTGDGGAAAAPHTEADSGRGNHAGGDDGRHAEQEDQQEEEEALLQQSSPTASAPQGLERWRGKVALVTGRRPQSRPDTLRTKVV